ncbi:hypothetical protein OQA88_715 [Cercophora sp. LCS_1]
MPSSSVSTDNATNDENGEPLLAGLIMSYSVAGTSPYPLVRELLGYGGRIGEEGDFHALHMALDSAMTMVYRLAEEKYQGPRTYQVLESGHESPEDESMWEPHDMLVTLIQKQKHVYGHLNAIFPSHGRRVLHLASDYRLDHIVELLLSEGADPLVMTGRRLLPIQHFTEILKYESILERDDESLNPGSGYILLTATMQRTTDRPLATKRMRWALSRYQLEWEDWKHMEICGGCKVADRRRRTNSSRISS